MSVDEMVSTNKEIKSMLANKGFLTLRLAGERYKGIVGELPEAAAGYANCSNHAERCAWLTQVLKVPVKAI